MIDDVSSNWEKTPEEELGNEIVEEYKNKKENVKVTILNRKNNPPRVFVEGEEDNEFKVVDRRYRDSIQEVKEVAYELLGRHNHGLGGEDQ